MQVSPSSTPVLSASAAGNGGLVAATDVTPVSAPRPSRTGPPPSPRREIAAIAPYRGGAPATPNVIAKLNSNECALGVSPRVTGAMQALLTASHRYPDADCTALRSAIGDHHGIDPARIVCGNGSDELIAHLCQAYGGHGTETIMNAHSFIQYDRATSLSGGRVVRVPERGATASQQDFTPDVDAILRAVTPRTRLVFLANPDNPTGACLPSGRVDRLHAGLPSHVLLVLDAAYAEFVARSDYKAGHELARRAENVVVLRTFSKMYGAAGLRVGWADAPPSVARVLNTVRSPFNVSAFGQAGSIAVLGDTAWQARGVAHNTAQKTRMTRDLDAAGIKVFPSEGNFLLLGFGSAGRASAADRFLRDRGILLRPMATPYGMPDKLRLSIGNDAECDAAVRALTDFAVSRSDRPAGAVAA